jgi:predicted transcriptional regulator
METSPRDPAELARERQRGWYGEPLGELFRGLITGLGLNQARLAGILGLSAPMLSQLMSGQRAKIGNPAVVGRLHWLRELAAEVADGTVSDEEAAERMAEIRASAGSALWEASVTGGTGGSTGRSIGGAGTVVRQPSTRRVVREVQSLLRACGSAEELLRAADAVEAQLPELADLLRVYGTGRTDDAVRHFEAHQD